MWPGEGSQKVTLQVPSHQITQKRGYLVGGEKIGLFYNKINADYLKFIAEENQLIREKGRF